MLELIESGLLWTFRILIGGALAVGVIALLYAFICRGKVHPDDQDKPLASQRVMTGHWRPGYAVRWGTWLGLLATLGPAIAVLIYALVSGDY